MRKLLPFLKAYKLQLIIGPFFKLLEAVLELIVPLVMARIIDVGVAGGNIPYIIQSGGIMLLLGAVGLCSALVCQKSASIASQGTGTALRNAMYKHINSLSFAELDKIGTPSLITRMTNDINQMQVAVAMLIRLVIRAPFLVIGAMIMAISINFQLSIIFIGAAVLIAVVLYFTMSKTIPFYKIIQKKLDRISLLASENLTGNRVIRAFSKQKAEKQRFNETSDDLARAAVRVGKISALLNPFTYIITNIGIVLVVWFGAGIVNVGGLSQGDIVALVNYMTQIMLALVVVANLVIIFTKASASAQRINEVFETKPSVVQGSSIAGDTTGENIIEFNNACFSYNNSENALDNINLKIKRGETVGIIGGTGSGKSTLVNLIPRFYDCTSGEVLVNGLNVKEYQFKALRKIMGIVPQRAVLFFGTINDNMRMAKADATDAEIDKALKISQSMEFVDKLPLKKETEISGGSKNISGGQRQRLTIARALVGEPQIVILDDSASALDYATDAALRRAIKEETQNMTVIIVSQRVATVKNCNKIAVMDNGKILDVGTHSSLVKSCEEYKEICLSQLSKEEVEADE